MYYLRHFIFGTTSQQKTTSKIKKTIEHLAINKNGCSLSNGYFD